MPRVTTSTHPLVALRAVCGLTRKQLATMAGITEAMVQHIELDRSKLPSAAAMRIEAKTGCEAGSLLDKASKPRTTGGEPFTRAAYDRWLCSAPSLEHLEAGLDDMTFRLRAILRASAGGSAFYSLLTALRSAMSEAASCAGLSAEVIAAELRKDAEIKTATMTVAALRKAEIAACPGFAAAFSKLKPAARCKVVIERFRGFPSDALAPTRGERGPLEGGAAVVVAARIATVELWRIERPDGSRVQFQIVTQEERARLPRGGAYRAASAAEPDRPAPLPKREGKPGRRKGGR
jgi:transcriptional regulator with XRE-family HTH domain